jgi:hypothetical protein
MDKKENLTGGTKAQQKEKSGEQLRRGELRVGRGAALSRRARQVEALQQLQQPLQRALFRPLLGLRECV